MRILSWFTVVLCLMPFAADALVTTDKVSAPDGCPTVMHDPLVTVVRGTPAEVTAKIECETGVVSTVRIFVRLSDVNKPVSMDMAGEGDGVYSATIPVSMFEGVTRFWYYLDARGKTETTQADEGVAQTRWFPVTILDGKDTKNDAGGGFFNRKAAYWVLGGAAAVAGAVVYEHNHGSSGGGATEDPPVLTPVPGVESDEDDDDQSDSESRNDPSPEPPTCVTTGAETVELANTLPCVPSSDLEIRVCNTCPNATITAAGSWGATDQATGYNGEGCGSAVPALTLAKPVLAVNYPVGSFTITVSANGQLIATIPWPSSDDEGDCL